MLFFDFGVFLAMPCSLRSSLTSVRTWALAVEVQSYNHWTAREFYIYVVLKFFFSAQQYYIDNSFICVCVCVCVHIVKEFRGYSNMYV